MSVSHLPPICVTIRAVPDLSVPYALARRGRGTAIVVRAGMTRREVREALGEHLRPAELALVRASLCEPTDPDALPADLDDVPTFPGQLLIAHADHVPVPYTERFG